MHCSTPLLNAQVHSIHHLMTLLVVFKMLSLFFEGVMWFNIKSHGSPVGWNVLYYIFAFLKGTFLFVVVLLVGTGWSLLKVRAWVPFAQRAMKCFCFAFWLSGFLLLHAHASASALRSRS